MIELEGLESTESGSYAGQEATASKGFNGGEPIMLGEVTVTNRMPGLFYRTWSGIKNFFSSKQFVFSGGYDFDVGLQAGLKSGIVNGEVNLMSVEVISGGFDVTKRDVWVNQSIADPGVVVKNEVSFGLQSPLKVNKNRNFNLQLKVGMTQRIRDRNGMEESGFVFTDYRKYTEVSVGVPVLNPNRKNITKPNSFRVGSNKEFIGIDETFDASFILEGSINFKIEYENEK